MTDFFVQCEEVWGTLTSDDVSRYINIQSKIHSLSYIKLIALLIKMIKTHGATLFAHKVCTANTTKINVKHYDEQITITCV